MTKPFNDLRDKMSIESRERSEKKARELGSQMIWPMMEWPGMGEDFGDCSTPAPEEKHRCFEFCSEAETLVRFGQDMFVFTDTDDRKFYLTVEEAKVISRYILKSLENKKTKENVMNEERPVVVCTDKRGVFFGYATDTKGDPIILKRARMCIYWSSACKGVLGLASIGPQPGSKIGKAVPEIELRQITCVIEMTKEAVEKWEEGLWA